MPTVLIETPIDAPIEVCFDLLRDPRLHAETSATVEGNFGLGQRVTFITKTFGIEQQLVVEVVKFERPRRITDRMIKGIFSFFEHVHEFEGRIDGTMMRDVIVWRSRFGIFGRAADRLFIGRKLRSLVTARNRRLKILAESR